MENVTKQNQNAIPQTFSRYLDKFFRNEFSEKGHLVDFTPTVDIAESEKHFEVHLHIPGVKKDEVKIDLNDNILTVSGERKIQNENKEKNFYSFENYYGSFSRSFNLPKTVDSNKIEAKYEDGILTIVIPKDEKSVTKKQISIK